MIEEATLEYLIEHAGYDDKLLHQEALGRARAIKEELRRLAEQRDIAVREAGKWAHRCGLRDGVIERVRALCEQVAREFPVPPNVNSLPAMLLALLDDMKDKLND